ncbi:MAG TPA: penicillin-insensitive murein endopeptidase, partial [Gaiellaceae bacterium]
VTWNPATDSRPNAPGRLFGHERTIRTVLDVLAAYRRDHPNAPKVVVGDISFRDGGTMDQHVSHQNGLDVDIYYPRHDGWLQAPRSTAQIDRRLAQRLLDGFVAAGARMVFVGYSTGLRGPSGVVVPYPNHENHMHVRFPTAG